MGRPEELAYLDRIRPGMAVADAMMTVQAYQLQDLIKGLSRIRNMKQLERKMETATSWRCAEASIYTLYYLHRKHSGLFKHLMVVGADAKKESPFKTNNYTLHNCFLVEDVNGVWYMGSPANYSKDESRNNYSRVSCGRDLSGVLSETTIVEGGEWPQEDEIRQLISRSYHTPYEGYTPSYGIQILFAYQVRIGHSVESEFKPPVTGDMVGFPILDQFFI